MVLAHAPLAKIPVLSSSKPAASSSITKSRRGWRTGAPGSWKFRFGYLPTQPRGRQENRDAGLVRRRANIRALSERMMHGVRVESPNAIDGDGRVLEHFVEVRRTLKGDPVRMRAPFHARQRRRKCTRSSASSRCRLRRPRPMSLSIAATRPDRSGPRNVQQRDRQPRRHPPFGERRDVAPGGSSAGDRVHLGTTAVFGVFSRIHRYAACCCRVTTMVQGSQAPCQVVNVACVVFVDDGRG